MTGEIEEKKTEIKTQQIEIADPFAFGQSAAEETRGMLQEAHQIAAQITTKEAYSRGIEIGVKINERQKTLESIIEREFLAPARKIKQNMDKLLRGVTEPMEAAKSALKVGLTRFREEEERKARIERERILAEERKRQEEQAARIKEENDRRIKEEEDARIAAAAEAEKAGDAIRAQRIMEAPKAIIAPAPVVVAPPVPISLPSETIERTAGEVRRVTWKGQVVDSRAFFMALAEGKIPPEAVEIKEGWLNKMAKTFKERVGNYVPGVSSVQISDTGFKS